MSATTPTEVPTTTCRFCKVEQPLDAEHFFSKRDGGFYENSRCKTCEKTMRAEMRARKAKKDAAAPAEPEIPLARRLPTMVTRTPVGKKFRYEAILADGTVSVVTGASTRVYTAASAYVRIAETDETGTKPLAEPYGPRIFLHARPDLAAKGSPDVNLLVKRGLYERIPGVISIVEQGAES